MQSSGRCARTIGRPSNLRSCTDDYTARDLVSASMYAAQQINIGDGSLRDCGFQTSATCCCMADHWRYSNSDSCSCCCSAAVAPRPCTMAGYKGLYRGCCWSGSGSCWWCSPAGRLAAPAAALGLASQAASLAAAPAAAAVRAPTELAGPSPCRQKASLLQTLRARLSVH